MIWLNAAVEAAAICYASARMGSGSGDTDASAVASEAGVNQLPLPRLGDFTPTWELADAMRRLQGNALEMLGFGPAECGYRIIASGPAWHLRKYDDAGEGPSLLIVAAPIKRPYIWDLAPAASAVRRCLRDGLSVFLLEWAAPSRRKKNGGLADYAGQAIGEAVAAVSHEANGAKPFLMGHSLGGTLAAIFAALDPTSIAGLVLLASPLCFNPGSSSFRDALVAMASSTISPAEIVPGSLLSELSAMASPETFVWSRLFDAALSLRDPRAANLHARIERWALDEFPLPGRLVHDILQSLYSENRFCDGTLRIGNKTVGPSCLQVATLTVINTADAIAPPRSIEPFFDTAPKGRVRMIEYPGESGVALQHLAPLVGFRAQTSLWPEIISWLEAMSRERALQVRCP